MEEEILDTLNAILYAVWVISFMLLLVMDSIYRSRK